MRAPDTYNSGRQRRLRAVWARREHALRHLRELRRAGLRIYRGIACATRYLDSEIKKTIDVDLASVEIGVWMDGF